MKPRARIFPQRVWLFLALMNAADAAFGSFFYSVDWSFQALTWGCIALATWCALQAVQR